jgi:hypothetical protein
MSEGRERTDETPTLADEPLSWPVVESSYLHKDDSAQCCVLDHDG